MPSPRSERALLHAIAKQLESDDLAPQDLSAVEVPASDGASLRTAGDQLRAKVLPIKRQRFLRESIAATGRTNHLIRFGCGKTYQAAINGKTYAGTFTQVWDQVAPFVLHLA